MKSTSRKEPKIFDIDALDGFWLSRGLDRTLHITFEAEDVLVFDLYDTVRAAYAPVGEPLAIVRLNLRTGGASEPTQE